MKTTKLRNRTDVEIARRIEVLRQELSDRAGDGAGAIRGQEFAKRACVVAGAGRHSLLLWGCRGVGKQRLARLAFDLGAVSVVRLEPCPCGHLGSVATACNCTAKQVHAYQRQNHVEADISIEVLYVPEMELTARRDGTTLEQLQAMVDRGVVNLNGVKSFTLDENGKALLKEACNTLGLGVGVRQRILSVARTIAALDGETSIKAVHMLEAIGYRPPDWQR